MSKKPTIKWREIDEQKLEKEIERFNNKIYRTRHRHPELRDILPETITKENKTKLLETIKSAPRNYFEKTLNSLDRFTRKGSEKETQSKTGNRITKWEKDEVSLKVATLNRERAKERKFAENMEATTRGEKTGLKRGEMGSERLNSLKPKSFNFDKIRGGKEWEKYKEGLERMLSPQAKDERLERYKANYIQGLKNAMGDYANDIIEILEKLPAEEIIRTYYQEQEASLDFMYDPISSEIKLEVLGEIWQNVADEYEEIHR